MARMLPLPRRQRHIVDHVDAGDPDAQVLDRQRTLRLVALAVAVAHRRAPNGDGRPRAGRMGHADVFGSARITADGIAKLTG